MLGWPPGIVLQVVCMGDLEVTKYGGFWGQGSTPLGPAPSGEVLAAPLLGSLEYVLEPMSAGKAAGRAAPQDQQQQQR